MADNLNVSHFIYMQIDLIPFTIEPAVQYSFTQSVLDLGCQKKEGTKMTSKKKFFKVTAKCGHVKKNQYIPITFAISAYNGEEVAKIARWIPRVKHHDKSAIIECVEIGYDQFVEIKKLNNKNVYLKCSSKQEQKRLLPNIDEYIEQEPIQNANENRDYERINYILKKQKQAEQWTAKLMNLGREEYSHQMIQI